MARQLELSSEAIQQLASIAHYLAEQFQVETLERFEEKWMVFTNTVEVNPHRYPFYETQLGKRLHKAVLLNLTIILYSFDDNKVMVEAIYDARSDWQREL